MIRDVRVGEPLQELGNVVALICCRGWDRNAQISACTLGAVLGVDSRRTSDIHINERLCTMRERCCVPETLQPRTPIHADADPIGVHGDFK